MTRPSPDIGFVKRLLGVRLDRGAETRKVGDYVEYQTPVVQDFGSIAAHTFIGQKNTIGPGHIDEKAECSGGSGSAEYPDPCVGKADPQGTFDTP